MDSVSNFVIKFDLNSVHTLYHIVSHEFIHRPSGGWDLSHLKDQTSFRCPEDIKDLSKLPGLVELMLQPERESEWLEKCHENKSFETAVDPFDNSISFPFYIVPIFKPGDRFTGNINLQCCYPMDIVDIQSVFLGRARVQQFSSFANNDYYADQHIVCKTHQTIWPPNAVGEVTTRSCWTCTKPKRTKLEAGNYRFPFDFKIPENALPSMQAVFPISKWYKYPDIVLINYTIRAKINAGKCFGRGSLFITQVIWVDRPVDIALLRTLLVVTEVTVRAGLLQSSGTVKIRATLAQNAFVRGEELIPLEIEIENQGHKNIVLIACQLVMHGTHTVRGSRSNNKREFVSAGGFWLNNDVTKPGEGNWFQALVPFDFGNMDSNLLPGGELSDCPIIDIKYYLKITLWRESFFRKRLHMEVPIHVGTFDSKIGDE